MLLFKTSTLCIYTCHHRQLLWRYSEWWPKTSRAGLLSIVHEPSVSLLLSERLYLIKTILQSSAGQGCLSDVAVVSISAELVQKSSYDDLINSFSREEMPLWSLLQLLMKCLFDSSVSYSKCWKQPFVNFSVILQKCFVLLIFMCN